MKEKKKININFNKQSKEKNGDIFESIRLSESSETDQYQINPDTLVPEPLFKEDFSNISKYKRRIIQKTKRCFVSCGVNSRWALYSNYLFLLGNVCYISVDITMLNNINCKKAEGQVDEVMSPCNLDEDWVDIMNIFAAVFFILNPISDFMGNW
eukprot:snap_masked-scaffold_8-processed-gene-8.40-mRNA-1 protein AED:1.00 eAED:1.00 QI:0/0/0/0/1/1/2/0/153